MISIITINIIIRNFGFLVGVIILGGLSIDSAFGGIFRREEERRRREEEEDEKMYIIKVSKQHYYQHHHHHQEEACSFQ